MNQHRPTIGVLLTTLIELHQVQWLGAVDAAREHDVNLVTFVGRELDSPLGFERNANFVYDLAEREQLDGLIVWTTALQLFAGAGQVEAICRRLDGLPIVTMEQALGDRPTLLIENRSGMNAAVSHLIEHHAHRRIAFLRGPGSHPGAEERYRGYLDALSEHGIELDPSLVSPVPSSWLPEEHAAWLRQLIVRREPVDAIVSVNDTSAAVAVATLDTAGLRVPDDVAVVGFDDIAGIFATVDPAESDVHLGREDRATEGDRLARGVNPSSTALPLTTVRPPFYGLGHRAVEVVLALRRGEEVPPVESLPTTLIVRRSCGCLPHTMLSDDEARHLGGERLPRLVASYRSYLEGGSDEPFLATVDELMRGGGRLEAAEARAWVEVLDVVRRSAEPEPPGAAERAAALWTRVNLLVAEAMDRFSAYERLVARKRDQLIRDLGQRLTATPNRDEFADELAAGLSSLRIPSCQLGRYPSGRRDGPGQAVLVREDERSLPLSPAERERFRLSFRPRLRDRAWSLVVLPLYFRERQHGFVCLEAGPRNGWVYEALQEQLSGALESVLLVDFERRANEHLHREIEQREAVEAALERARDELEARVIARTADLAEANAGLTAEIRERERAEQEREALEAQLRQAQKMEAVGRLAGGIAHDFNNILVVINGLTALLLEKLPEGAETRAELEQVQQAGARAADLTRRLLVFSRRQVLRPAILNLNRVVSDLVPMLGRLISEDIVLETRLDPTVAPVVADEAQLGQVIVNLAVNARDAMPDGGTLTIETTNEERSVRLRVRDTGVGIDAETQEHLFEPFFTTKPAGHGTGLGLATVFGIVQQSGGTVSVSSEPGLGATFDIVLPAMTDDAPGAPAPSLTPPEHAGGSETILLVEDDASVRRASRLFLEARGYRVLEAGDGADALAICERHHGTIDLMVTDVVMPGIGGAALAERVRELRPDLPVMFVSGYVDSALTHRLLGDEGVSLLQKPFDAHALAAKVREVLAAAAETRAANGSL